MHTQKVPQQVIHFVFFNLKLRKTVEAGLWEVHLLAFLEAILLLPSILCRWLDFHVCFKRLPSVPKLAILSTPLSSRQLFSRHSLSDTQKTRSLPRKVTQLKAKPGGPDHVTTRPSPSPRSALPQPPRSHGEPQRKVTKCFLFQPDHKGWKVPYGTTTWAYSCRLQLSLAHF